MADIKRLLRKKGWTGKELGQIVIGNICQMWESQKNGETPKSLYTKEDLKKMLDTLTDSIQIDTYNGYMKLYDWLKTAYNVADAQQQQMQLKLEKISSYIQVSDALEETYAYIEKLPVIMTQKQYEDFTAQREQEILKNFKDFDRNLFWMLDFALTSLLNQLETHPNKANPLKALKPKLEKEKVKDPRILKLYNEVAGNGYYEIDETGERSDQMTEEEWEKALEAPELPAEQRVKCGRTIPTKIAKIDTIARATFDGATEDELKKIENKYSCKKHYTFHPYDTPPEDLNRWDVLECNTEIHDIYPSLKDMDKDGQELTKETYKQAVLEDITAFKEEFPKVFEALRKDMKKYLGDVVNKPIEEWADITYSWEEIRKLNFYTFNETFFGNTGVFDGNGRALFNGVAILQEGWTFKPSGIDERGYYKAPDILDSLAPLSIAKFFPDAPNYADHAELMEDNRERLLESYYFLLGFNKAIEIVAKHFDLPSIKVFKFQVDVLANRTEAIDTLAAFLYKKIKDRNYEDKELQSKKLEALKNFFYPLECEKMEIPQENIDKAIEGLSDTRIFEDMKLTQILCVRH